jgi:hypothetical protein
MVLKPFTVVWNHGDTPKPKSTIRQGQIDKTYRRLFRKSGRALKPVQCRSKSHSPNLHGPKGFSGFFGRAKDKSGALPSEHFIRCYALDAHTDAGIRNFDLANRCRGNFVGNNDVIARMGLGYQIVI